MKILVLTSVYPQPDDEKSAGITPVVYYFAKEWIKKGHEVIVIHNSNRFPLPFYLIPDKIVQMVNSKLGMVAPKISQRNYLFNNEDGIKSYRMPMTKVIPKGKFFNYQIVRQYNKIIRILNDNNFTPDVVLGHWENPQVPLISMLKQKYGCRTSVVLHGINYINKKSYSKWVDNHLSNIDIIGGRSNSIVKEIKTSIDKNKKTFVCYSGIPTEYVIDNNKYNFNENRFKRNSYLYVGQLIKRKNVDTIIKALSIAHPNKDFTFNIVGIGSEEIPLKKLVNTLGLEKQINFLGRLSRKNVIEIMKDTSCFTMVSEKEVFGLVYLEALSCGCIVVASKNEGIDGVIIDNENGFLCQAGNIHELSNVYKKIHNLSKHEKSTISIKSIKTAYEFTNEKVADKYLNEVLN